MNIHQKERIFFFFFTHAITILSLSVCDEKVKIENNSLQTPNFFVISYKSVYRNLIGDTQESQVDENEKKKNPRVRRKGRCSLS